MASNPVELVEPAQGWAAWKAALKRGVKVGWLPAGFVVVAMLVSGLFQLLQDRDDDLYAVVQWPERLSPSVEGRLLVSARVEGDPGAGATVSLYRTPARDAGGWVSEEEQLKALEGQGATAQADARGLASLPLAPVEGEPGQKLNLIVKVEHAGKARLYSREYVMPPKVALALLTDRPLYQPGQLVRMSALAVDADRGTPASGQARWEVRDPRGNLVFEKEAPTSAAGVTAADFPLASECVQGDYAVTVSVQGITAREVVEVQPYRLPRMKVEVRPKQPRLAPGGVLEGEVAATTIYGEPVVGAEVDLTISFSTQRGPRVEPVEGKLGEAGRFAFSWESPRDLREGAPIELEAVVTSDAGRAERGEASVAGGTSGWSVELLPENPEGFVGGQGTAFLLVRDGEGKGLAGAQVSLVVQEDRQERTVEATTDAQGRAEVRLAPRWGGSVVRARVQHGQGAAVEVDLPIHASANNLYIKADAGYAVVGEPWRFEVGGGVRGAVVAWKRGYPVAVGSIEDGQGEVVFPAEATGLVQLDALGPDYSRLSSTKLWVRPAGASGVEVKTEKAVYAPGEGASVELGFPATAGPSAGQAPAAPVTFHLVGVDEALYALKERSGAPLPLLLREGEGLDLAGLARALGSLEEADQGDALGRKIGRARFAREVPAVSLGSYGYPNDLTRAWRIQQLRPFAQGWILFLSALALGATFLAARTTWRAFSRESFSWWRLLFQGLVALGGFVVLVAMSAASGEYAAGGLTVWMILAVAWLVGAAVRRPSLKLGAWLGLLLLLGLLGASCALCMEASRSLDWAEGVAAVAFGLPSALLFFEMILWSFALQHRGERQAGLGVAALLGVVLALPLLTLVTRGGGRYYDAMPEMAMQAAPAPTMFKAEAKEAEEAPGRADDEGNGPTTGKEGGAVAANAAPRVRKYFPETLVWAPEVRSDAQGRARVPLELPDSITTWRLDATAATWDGRFGVGRAPLKVWQPFFVEVELPTRLTVGDRLEIPVALVHKGEAPKDLQLTAQGAGGLAVVQGLPATASIPADGRQVLTLVVEATAPGQGSLRVQAQGQGLGDAIEVAATVEPDGRTLALSRSGFVGERWEALASVPADALPGTARVEVAVFPGLAADALEGLEGMLRMPTGCFEQTSSANYPNVLVLRLLKATPPDQWPGGPDAWAKADADARRFLSLGYQRVLSFQDASGGFRLYPKEDLEPQIMLTAYGLMQLSEQAEVMPVDPNVLRRAADWLMRQQNPDGTWPVYAGRAPGGDWSDDSDPGMLRSTAFVTWAMLRSPLGQENRARLDKALDHLAAKHEATGSPDTLGLVANALLAAGRKSDADAVLSRLVATLKRDGDRAWWEADQATWMGGRYSYADLEASAIGLYALMVGESHGELTQPLLRHIAAARSPLGGWGSTQATVWALRVFERLRAGVKPGPTTLSVSLDGLPMQEDLATAGATPGTLTLAPGDALLRRLRAPSLAAGDHRVQILATPKTDATAQLSTRFAVPWGSARAKVQGERIAVDLSPKLRAVKRGQPLEILATLRNPGRDHLGAWIAELPVPPGAYVPPESLEALEQQGLIDRFEVLPTHVRLYLGHLAPQTSTKLVYEVVPLVKGAVSLPPARAYIFYAPDPITEVNSGDLTVE